MDKYDFGYPRACARCGGLGGASPCLKVEPHFREGNDLRLMLVGQDPTIRKAPERVKEVLMLNEDRGQLRRWLSKIFGEEEFKHLTLYATNIVKCSFSQVPSHAEAGAERFLQPYFNNCKDYLVKEITTFKPQILITLGETAHSLLLPILTGGQPPKSMKKAFTGEFLKVTVQDVNFLYSPCLHIATFRVAEKYGSAIEPFKSAVRGLLRGGGMKP